MLPCAVKNINHRKNY